MQQYAISAVLVALSVIQVGGSGTLNRWLRYAKLGVQVCFISLYQVTKLVVNEFMK